MISIHRMKPRILARHWSNQVFARRIIDRNSIPGSYFWESFSLVLRQTPGFDAAREIFNQYLINIQFQLRELRGQDAAILGTRHRQLLELEQIWHNQMKTIETREFKSLWESLEHYRPRSQGAETAAHTVTEPALSERKSGETVRTAPLAAVMEPPGRRGKKSPLVHYNAVAAVIRRQWSGPAYAITEQNLPGAGNFPFVYDPRQAAPVPVGPGESRPGVSYTGTGWTPSRRSPFALLRYAFSTQVSEEKMLVRMLQEYGYPGSPFIAGSSRGLDRDIPAFDRQVRLLAPGAVTPMPVFATGSPLFPYSDGRMIRAGNMPVFVAGSSLFSGLDATREDWSDAGFYRLPELWHISPPAFGTPGMLRDAPDSVGRAGYRDNLAGLTIGRQLSRLQQIIETVPAWLGAVPTGGPELLRWMKDPYAITVPGEILARNAVHRHLSRLTEIFQVSLTPLSGSGYDAVLRSMAIAPGSTRHQREGFVSRGRGPRLRSDLVWPDRQAARAEFALVPLRPTPLFALLGSWLNPSTSGVFPGHRELSSLLGFWLNPMILPDGPGDVKRRDSDRREEPGSFPAGDNLLPAMIRSVLLEREEEQVRLGNPLWSRYGLGRRGLEAGGFNQDFISRILEGRLLIPQKRINLLIPPGSAGMSADGLNLVYLTPAMIAGEAAGPKPPVVQLEQVSEDSRIYRYYQDLAEKVVREQAGRVGDILRLRLQVMERKSQEAEQLLLKSTSGLLGEPFRLLRMAEEIIGDRVSRMRQIFQIKARAADLRYRENQNRTLYRAAEALMEPGYRRRLAENIIKEQVARLTEPLVVEARQRGPEGREGSGAGEILRPGQENRLETAIPGRRQIARYLLRSALRPQGYIQAAGQSLIHTDTEASRARIMRYLGEFIPGVPRGTSAEEQGNLLSEKLLMSLRARGLNLPLLRAGQGAASEPRLTQQPAGRRSAITEADFSFRDLIRHVYPEAGPGQYRSLQGIRRLLEAVSSPQPGNRGGEPREVQGLRPILAQYYFREDIWNLLADRSRSGRSEKPGRRLIREMGPRTGLLRPDGLGTSIRNYYQWLQLVYQQAARQQGNTAAGTVQILRELGNSEETARLLRPGIPGRISSLTHRESDVGAGWAQNLPARALLTAGLPRPSAVAERAVGEPGLTHQLPARFMPRTAQYPGGDLEMVHGLNPARGMQSGDGFSYGAESPGTKQTLQTTVAVESSGSALALSNAEVKRIADRVYREIEQKTKIERQRRGM
jgi:hypothetical protein